jgi:16S rRNA A1518/A1519 N6-dimethyltransferase RsmA/KsgA/DIM1 with predicted DNA glycosylase/AP lyase activity
MSEDHYFSQEPSSPLKPKTIQIPVAGEIVNVTSASGTFSPAQLDFGTEVLIEQIDLAPISGNLLDLGCGWGPIALNLAKLRPKTKVWAVDVNTRSVELTQANARNLGISNINAVLPDQVPADLRFSGIWSNPPIRIGKKELHELLLMWLPRLEARGEAYLVVQKNLGSDSLQKWLTEELANGYEVSRYTSIKTYRVLKIKKSS